MLRLTKVLNVAKYTSHRVRKLVPINYHRNLCVILGVLAEKLPGPSSAAMLTPSTLDYLIMNLVLCFSIFEHGNTIQLKTRY